MFKNAIDFKKMPKLLLIFGLFMFSSLFQLLLEPFVDFDIYHPSNFQNLLLTCFSDMCLLIILVIIYFKTLKEDIKKMKTDFNKKLEIGIKAWLIGLGVMMVANVLIGLLTPAKAVNEEAVQEMIKSAKLISIIAVGIIGPIIEELVFRKSFREVFKNNALFALMSGLVFGSLHVVLTLSGPSDLLYIIPYSSLGIAFAYMYIKTDSIYTSMIMHIFHNTVLTAMSVYGLGVILW